MKDGARRLVSFSIEGLDTVGAVYVDSAPCGVTVSAAGNVPNWRWEARTVEFSTGSEGYAWAAYLAGWGERPA